MSQKSLNQLVGKVDLDGLKKALLSETGTESRDAGLKLASDAASYGLNVRDYLLLGVGRESDSKDALNGYERTLYALNLPVRNDFENGVFLQAASETFQTYAGTRAMFPEVIDDVLRFSTRQDQVEQVAPMLANSRTISGFEMISTVVDDDSKERDSFQVPEGARIPVRSIKTSQNSVKIYKHGSGLRTTYEFGRRAQLDILVPFANRIARELELSKVKAATDLLVNGDGVNGAATVISQSSYDSTSGTTSTNGKINWANFLVWLVKRAQAGAPIDTVVMNWDGLVQWMLMFGNPTSAAGSTPVENLARAGVTLTPTTLNMILTIRPVVSSSAPANKLIGFSKGDTMEELKEAGSDIQETERVITNQTLTLVKTENTGYKLVYGDTRSIYNFGA